MPTDDLLVHVPDASRQEFVQRFNSNMLPLLSNPIFNHIPQPLNTGSLTSNVEATFPILKYMLNCYETSPDTTRRFSLFPNPNLQWKFMTIDTQTLKGFVKSFKIRVKHQGNYKTGLSLFDHVFNFKKIGIKKYVYFVVFTYILSTYMNYYIALMSLQTCTKERRACSQTYFYPMVTLAEPYS